MRRDSTVRVPTGVLQTPAVTPPADDRPWLSQYAPGVPADIAEPTASLPRLLQEAAQRFAARPVTDFSGATTTYAELLSTASRAAEALRRLGVEAGDRVALALPNTPQHLVAFYAVLRLGAVVVELNPLHTAEELRAQLSDCGARVVVTWPGSSAAVHEALRAAAGPDGVLLVADLVAELPLAKRVALRLPLARARAQRAQLVAPRPEGSRSWERAVAAAGPLDPAHPEPALGDVAALLYTGGTTGSPKAVVLTHRNLAANAAQGRAWVPGMREGEEVVLAVLPLFHAYGLTLCLTFAVSTGACLLLLPRFDVDAVLAAWRRRPATFVPGVPPIYQRLAQAARERGADLSSARYALSGAMPLPPATVALWEEVTGGLLVEGYGMTEASPVALGNPISPARRPGSIGVPFPSTRMRVVDPEDPTTDVAPGQRGELLLHGPQVFAGYWRRPEETAASLLPGGWLRTGDVVEVDADGYVRVVDRIKELVIVGGFNVHPSEVEAVLRAHPDIDDAAVVGLPDDTTGERVAAAVVARAGALVDTEALRAWARERLAGYKVPSVVDLVHELPRSQLGKVLRRVVRERMARERSTRQGR